MPDAVNEDNVERIMVAKDLHKNDIKFSEDISDGKSGVKIYRWRYEPLRKSPRALVFIAHGYCEHSRRYDRLARHLSSELQCLVFSHDHIGHGKSEGERVFVGTFDVYVEDIFEHIDEVRKAYPDPPVYLFGHSMGGTISILAASKRPDFFCGVVLSAPAIVLDPALTPGAFKKFIGNIMNHFFPKLIAFPPIDPSVVSSDPDQVKAYVNDPLIWHDGVKLGLAKSFGDAMDRVQDYIPSIEWPFLVLHGDSDKLTYIGGSILLEKEAKSKDKEIKIYKGLKHEILNEVKEEAEQVMSDIVEWLRKRIVTQQQD